ncbi:MAG: UDP-N-acetylmuramoyl-tripeptide--D-alanyl-D-alanine ligase [Candidatus Latescibacteria bacterium]|nr:UDP-N-acetylmuramoyl-tripeptide--D-alanyl-D-alanine ligase [Candidatus Latescibacterota bacterium]
MITPDWIAARLGAHGLLRESRTGTRPLRGARQDSRSLRPGELFVALKGERADGHVHADAALAAGAGGALLGDAGRYAALAAAHPDASLYLVTSPLGALQQLAADYLASLGAVVVGVTGSNGKTATKDCCRALLATLGPCYASEGNFNNLIGLPMTVLAAPADTRYLVLEMGCSGFGEIAALAALFPPFAGIITNIGAAHLEQLGDLDGVARAKGELAAALPADGLLLLDAAGPYTARLAARSRARLLRYGHGAGDLVLEDLGPDGPGARRLRVDGQTLTLPRPWRHSQLALGAAWLLARTLGAAPEALAAAAPGAFRETNRGGTRPLGDWTVVDDSYNANPDSMRAALEWLAAAPLPAEARRWAVLGDMLELGDGAADLHRALGERAAVLGTAGAIAGLFAYGPLSRALVDAARAAGLDAAHFDDHAALAEALAARLAPGDLLLVKGSRGMAMETVIRLLERAAARTGESRR